ncbi:hypothetical protein GH714_010199 [Hevea brasiliensis]|uniref:TF-B3 domain-containing protein n=1 Tax=Hevea brasiliensis TaxID=3981 RepID=A0A6A6MXQ2_HEVBR|nr:hypothetical protein GH714_010199 [Hevea brasiliensis]
MVDLLRRAGLFDEILHLIKEISRDPADAKTCLSAEEDGVERDEGTIVVRRYVFSVSTDPSEAVEELLRKRGIEGEEVYFSKGKGPIGPMLFTKGCTLTACVNWLDCGGALELRRERNFGKRNGMGRTEEARLQGFMEDRRRGIPIKFVEDYGYCLTSPVTLQDPTGTSWKVELLKNGNEVWLEKGWPEFSENHTLKYGHLLVFEYKGDSLFHVFIFDKTAVEIEYSVKLNFDGESPQPKKQEIDDHDSISCHNLDDPIRNGKPIQR